MVAIPSVMLFNWLSGLIAKYEAGLANAGSELVDQLEAGALGGASDAREDESDTMRGPGTHFMNGEASAHLPAE